jgi:hypothetical protein
MTPPGSTHAASMDVRDFVRVGLRRSCDEYMRMPLALVVCVLFNRIQATRIVTRALQSEQKKKRKLR